MVFQKSMDCVSSKCQIPPMPRVPRSAKRRRSSRKRIVSKNQMCAIDLLATLAGKLLEERSEFWDPSKMPGKSTRESESPVKDGSFCHGSCDESTVAPLQVIPQTSGSLIYDDTTNACALKDPTNLDRRPQVIVSSDSSVEFPLYRDCQKALNSSFSLITEGMPGENSSESTHPEHTHHPKAFKACCLEHNRKRKAIKSSCRKTDPLSYNCKGMTNDDVQMKPVFQNPKLFYTRQRSQRSPFKKRKLFGSCLVSQFCGSSRDNDFKDLAVKDVNRLDAAESDSIEALNRANVLSCSSNDQNSTFESEGHPVKLSIKSFKVPELSIEIPANSTVGSLKRAVTEAVMSILGDGLCVGVLLQGNKVGDDDKSLRQAGISYENKMDGLGFTLEPNPTKAPKHRCSLKKPAFMACDPEPLNMFQADPIPISGTNSTESDRENSVDSNCKALVMVSAADQSKPLSVILMGRSRPSDFSQQRRIRRPFSVSEVEALVEAVEKLGTGRWRDVKLRSFGNSKHRTYVDLKDKWKTLVHTARISPQQRRGEPVPQKLLDRVLSAHAFWSQPGPDHAPLLLQK